MENKNTGTATAFPGARIVSGSPAGKCGNCDRIFLFKAGAQDGMKVRTGWLSSFGQIEAGNQKNAG
jgi:hypothetical protein